MKVAKRLKPGYRPSTQTGNNTKKFHMIIKKGQAWKFIRIQALLVNKGCFSTCSLNSILPLCLACLLVTSVKTSGQNIAPPSPPRSADTIIADQSLTLPVVIVNSVNVDHLLRRIKNDTSFYKAFKTLHIVNYEAENQIDIFNRKGKVKASYQSTSRQIRQGDCRMTKIIDQTTTGDFINRKGDFNYTIGGLFASLFFAKGKVCGETNIVNGSMDFKTVGLSGIDKKKEQLKMLFFNPGRKITGIPFIGNKLDLYDKDAMKIYNYRLDTITFGERHGFEFTITPRPGAKGIVIHYMRTVFDAETLDVLYRSYSLRYKAGVYDFDVKMNVSLEHRNGQLVPIHLSYNGNWSVILKKRERARFSASFTNFH